MGSLSALLYLAYGFIAGALFAALCKDFTTYEERWTNGWIATMNHAGWMRAWRVTQAAACSLIWPVLFVGAAVAAIAAVALSVTAAARSARRRSR